MDGATITSIVFRLLAIASMLCCAFGMMCEQVHPQTAVCRASYVVKVRILKLDWREERVEQSQNAKNISSPIKRAPMPPRNPFGVKKMQVRLLRLYKGYRQVNASKGDIIYINYPPFHLPIKEGEDYLFTGWSQGTSLQISVCDWFTRWQDLTISQKFGIKRYYFWMFCPCRIRTCYGEDCTRQTRGRRECLINFQTHDCNSRKNICMVRNQRCDWDSPKGRTVCDQPKQSLIP
eukprot:gene5301-5970_t